MGYESKVYVVDKTNQKFPDEKRYAQVIATYELSKMGNFVDIFKKETDCFIYADDGNTQILEDKYGDSLKEATVKDVIKYLRTFNKTQPYYRRINPLLGLLKEFVVEDWDDLVVLHYGY